MKCYYHQDVDAVGLCKACSKGVCAQCATDIGGGLACAATCITQVRSINSLIKSNTKAASLNRRATYLWPAFLVILGAVFIIAPLLQGESIEAFPLVAGSTFFLFGIIIGAYQYVWRKSTDIPAQQGAPADGRKAGRS